MDREVLDLTRRLQATLDGVDPQKDRDTLVWAHGWLTGLVDRIQSRIPDLGHRSADMISASDSLAEVKRILAELKASTISNDDPSDSLDEIERELGGPDGLSVPSRRKPGPKGLSGGAALPLPDDRFRM